MKPIISILFIITFGVNTFAQPLLRHQGNNNEANSLLTLSNYNPINHQKQDWLLFDVIEEIVVLPFYLIYKFPNEPSIFASLDEGGVGFTKYPYKENKYGLYYKPYDGGRTWSGEFRGHYYWGDPYQGLYGDARFSPVPAFNIEMSNHFLFEILPDGKRQYWDFTNIGITYNRLRYSRLQLNYGLGLFNIRSENYYGLSIMFGASIYIRAPFSIHYSGQLTPYDGLWMLVHQFRGQYHFRRFYAYIGNHRIINSVIDNSGIALGLGVHY